MEYKTSAEIERLGDIIRPSELTQDQLLERWAQALERRGAERLHTLRETEHRPPHELIGLRRDNTALSVAYDDPVLRAAGLRGDSFDEAGRFFGLSNWQLHNIVCYCHLGDAMPASDAAARVRSYLTGPAPSAALVVRGVAVGSAVVAGLALVSLLL